MMWITILQELRIFYRHEESLNLSENQKIYRLIFSYSVLSQLMLYTKKLKKTADQSAVNTLRRMTRREERRKRKKKIM
jgi:hypothetical protein